MSGPKSHDITGQKFGRLTALCRIGRTKGRVSIWECQCECGKKHNAIISQLRNGDVQSCGCIRRVENPVAKERLFNIWQGMRQRCNNPNANYYEYYGAKGVKVCKEWDEYKVFKKWAIDNGYDDDLSIDRIDNDNGYNPGNCRWTSLKEQQSNKSNNVLVTYWGEVITLAELSRRTGLSAPTLHRRYRAGYTGEKLWQTAHLQTGKEINALKYKVKIDIEDGSSRGKI